jgi:GDP-L-fucose synthase
MYPANREHALRVEDLMTGSLEPTNFDYAMAKLAGAQLVSSVAETEKASWRNLIASNLYGPGDYFDSDRSHLLASIIHKSQVVSADSLNQIEMWGDGKPRREFTFVEDLALWIAHAITKLNELPTFLNVGFGQDYSVLQYYQFVLQAMNLNVEIKMDLSKPSGNSRKLMDSSVAKSFGWNPSTTIHEGINRTIDWYRQGLRT